MMAMANKAGADSMLDIAEHQLARPDRRLEGEGDDEQSVDGAHQGGRRIGMLGDQLGRGRDHEIELGPGEHPREDHRPVRVAAPPRDQPAPQRAQRQHGKDDQGPDRRGDDDPHDIATHPLGRFRRQALALRGDVHGRVRDASVFRLDEEHQASAFTFFAASAANSASA
jgi:hypothetical protein